MRRGLSAAALYHGRRLFRFGLSGGLSAITDFTVYAIAIALGAAPAVANVISFCFANPQSYFVNSRVTFNQGAAPAPISARGYARFMFAHSISLAASTALIFVAAPHVGPFIAKAVAVAMAFFWNYTMSARFVFRAARPDRPPGSESL